MSVREAGLRVGVVLGFEPVGNPNKRLARLVVEAFLANQDAPQLNGGIGQSMAFDGIGGAVIEKDRQVRHAGHFVGQTRELPVAVRPLPPLGLANRHLAEGDLVAAQSPSPHPVSRSPRSKARRKNPDSAAPSTLTIS